MTKLEHALDLAAKGFYVFPCLSNSKEPLIKNYSARATVNKETIEAWWRDPILNVTRDYNIGIACSRFGGGGSLFVIDIDPKNGGFETELELELQGKEFGNTFSQQTASGGVHYIYATEQRLRQGAHVLGAGIDSRSAGGYILGAGSTIGDRPYLLKNRVGLIAPPEWVIEALKNIPEIQEPIIEAEEINEGYAKERAIFFLDHEAPKAIEGVGGNQATYRTAARIKDFGVDIITAKDLLLERYNQQKCEPPWSESELSNIVENVYLYGKNEIGVLAPEKQFEKVAAKVQEQKLSPIQELNKNHAFVMVGSSYVILHETKDEKGTERTEFWQEAAFHAKYLNKTMIIKGKEGKEDRTVHVTREWMKHPSRRTYSGVVFSPEKDCAPGDYNLWKGFTYKLAPPGTGEEHESVQAFLEHAEENVCCGDPELFRWLIGYFAHLIQRPYEKPNTALVFKGEKGTGKTTLVDSIGALLESCYKTVDNSDEILSNFNASLENCLALTMEEAFWSGDKKAEGILKNMITGKRHRIERKGVDAYYVQNLTRVFIIGNDYWLVPASEDERRYAVFNVKNTRKGDWKFFKNMRLGFEAGGYSYLLRYLKDYDISNFNFEQAPNTKGLYEQKLASLDALGRWWFECISEGQIMGSANEDWPLEINRRDLYEAFCSYCRQRRDRKYGYETIPSFLRKLEERTGSLKLVFKRVNQSRERTVILPSVKECRDTWDKKMKFQGEWDAD